MNNRIFSFRDDESWSDYESPNEVFSEMFDDDALQVGNTFFTGIKHVPSPTQFIIDADEVLENYDLRIDDNYHSDYTDGNTGTDGVTKEAKDNLNKLLNEWAKQNLTITFWGVNQQETILITQEMIDAFHANKPIPLPKFKLKEGTNE